MTNFSYTPSAETAQTIREIRIDPVTCHCGSVYLIIPARSKIDELGRAMVNCAQCKTSRFFDIPKLAHPTEIGVSVNGHIYGTQSVAGRVGGASASSPRRFLGGTNNKENPHE